MPLMGSIYVGSSGLQTSSNSLNTAAHNLANVETAGYTRQQILQGNKFYNNIGIAAVSDMQVGIGVDYTKCRQVRDTFLDASYRKESGRASFYEICSESTSEIETLLGEMEGASFKDSLAKLWTSVQELQKDPSSSVTQGVFVSTCAQFLERASAVSKGLNEYQINLESRVSGMVEDINTKTDRIFQLNNLIQKNEIGVEEANDYRDERNHLLDQLSKLISIKTVENVNGGVEIYAEGSPLLIGDTVNHLEVVNSDDGFSKVTWGSLYDYQEVFNFHQTIASEFNSDIGELKALLLARGDHKANYSDLQKGTTQEEAYNYYNYGTENTNDIPIASSIVMNAQGEFDRLIHNIVTSINNVICGNTPDESKATGIEVFERLGTDRYSAGQYVKENTDNSPSDVSSMYTVSNIRVNPDLLKQPTLNSFIKDDKSVDFEKATKLVEVFAGTAQVRDLNQTAETWINSAWTLNPNVSSKLGYVAFYDGVVGSLANVGSVYNSIVSSQQVTVDSLEDSRQQVLGVSSEEELQNIIKFQNAYNASSRYINVINDMLDTIINSMQ